METYVDFLPHLHLLVDQGEEALLLRAKHLGGPFLSFGFSRPFGQGEYPLLGIAAAVSRGHYSFRLFIRLTWRKTEGGKKGWGVSSSTLTLGSSLFPTFYILSRNTGRANRDLPPFRRLTTNRSCAHRPMYTRSVFSTAPHGSKPIIFSLLLFCSIVFSRRDDLEEPLLHSLCRTHASRP